MLSFVFKFRSICFEFVVSLCTQIVSKLQSKISPEKGIHYIAVNASSPNERDYARAFEEIEKPMPFFLNTTKNEQEWGNYYPFTLSIKSPESLYDFINGDVFIFVVLDFSVIEKKSKEIGFDVEPVFDGVISLKFIKSVGSGESLEFLMSDHLFGRVPYEFLSLEWLFNEVKSSLESIENEITSQKKV